MCCEYDDDLLQASTEEGRLKAMKDAVSVFFKNGTVLEEKKISQGGLNGREVLIEAEVPNGNSAKGYVRNRLFWADSKLYGVMVVYMPEFFNTPAADYFLDSFRIITTAPRP
jgi:hypothetical protein